MISSEIIQLGPDSIVTYPDTDILCFNVTTSGGRSVKELSRKRYVPIRHEVRDLGIFELVRRAEDRGWKRLWSAVELTGNSDEMVASQFSSFWSWFSRKELKLTAEDRVLYSCRHAFKDALKRLGVAFDQQNLLMGHAEPGTGSRYGTRKNAAPTPIEDLDTVIQSLRWPFLTGFLPPKI